MSPWTTSHSEQQRRMPGRLSFSDGDVTVKSSDRVEFRLHKLYLSLASPYFRMVLSNIPSSVPETSLSLPIILDETAWAFNFLLQYIYPIPQKRTVESLGNAVALYRAATKLQIDIAAPRLLDDLLRLLDATPNPIRAWAVASQLQLEEARLSAMNRLVRLDTVSSNAYLTEKVDELQHVTGFALCALLSWQASEVANAGSILPRIIRSWIPGAGAVDACRVDTKPEAQTCPITPSHFNLFIPISFPDGDVIVESNDGAQFQLHSLCLSHASLHFKNELLPLAFCIPPSPKSHVFVDENAHILNILFHYMYPTPQKQAIDTPELAVDVLRAARKLKVQVAIPPILKVLVHALDLIPNPLRAWALAVYADAYEARLQAMRRFIALSESSSAKYLAENVAELRYVTGLDLYGLLEWRRGAVADAQGMLRSAWTGRCDAHGHLGAVPLWPLEDQLALLFDRVGLWSEETLSDATFDRQCRLAERIPCPLCGPTTVSSLRLDMEIRLADALAHAPLG